MSSSIDHIDMSSFVGRELILRGPHVAQVLYTLYGGYLSYIAITNLQKYEATSKKLAEWSKEAENQLWKTRTTQASGVLAVCARPHRPRHLMSHSHGRFSPPSSELSAWPSFQRLSLG